MLKIFIIFLISFSFLLNVDANQSIKNPSEIEAKIDAANRFAKNGNYTEAEAELNAVIAKNTGNARAYKLRGHVYYAMGDYKRALKDLDRVVALVPNHPNALVDRAIVHSMMGHHGQALTDVEQALVLKPDSHFAQAVRKKILEMASD